MATTLFFVHKKKRKQPRKQGPSKKRYFRRTVYDQDDDDEIKAPIFLVWKKHNNNNEKAVERRPRVTALDHRLVPNWVASTVRFTLLKVSSIDFFVSLYALQRSTLSLEQTPPPLFHWLWLHPFKKPDFWTLLFFFLNSFSTLYFSLPLYDFVCPSVYAQFLYTCDFSSVCSRFSFFAFTGTLGALWCCRPLDGTRPVGNTSK